tara:strand:+ start:3056 stop:3460 length:405 start_codon:yes stop_codon:yes gene_type:complete
MTKEHIEPEQLELPFTEPLGPDDVHNNEEAMRVTTPRASILRTAEKYITSDRAVQHGEMKNNFATIASYWSEHLGTRVTAIDVSVMMTLLKIARLKSSEENFDNWVDACGYLACGGELVDNDIRNISAAVDRGM